ncbi:MAG: glycosyltransferase family 2 protein [Butyrivibrio sp.]|nr:glycosyltransferase family 2 protein [Butyrivibrio sp.]
MPESMPKITVVIPAYNIESLVEKCVTSVAEQDYPKDKLEIIVVDDGSTDSTGAICDELSSKYENVTALHKENGGSSSARNLGMKHATGDYIGFVDSDDYVDPRMYRVLAEAAVKFDADMVQISRDEISEDGTRLPDVVIPPTGIMGISSGEQLKKLLLHTGDASFCTKITRKSVFAEDLRFPEGELNEDFRLMIDVLPRVNKLIILPEQYYHVFYRLGSNSRKKAEDKDYFPSVFTDIVRNADVALDIVKEKYKNLVPIAERFGYYQRLDYLLHIPVSKMTKDNLFYMGVVKYVRKNILSIITNKYLTRKNKAYLCILAPAPRLVRSLHAAFRGL